jgi:hypothetical protein
MADSPSRHFFDVPVKRVHHGILVVLISLYERRARYPRATVPGSAE